METLDYWTPADALAFRCSVEQVGTLKPAAPMPSEETGISDLARVYAPRALRALARIAETSDSAAGVNAARALLELAYPGAFSPPAPAKPIRDESASRMSPDLPAPPWLKPDRLAYQAGTPNADACLGND